MRGSFRGICEFKATNASKHGSGRSFLVPLICLCRVSAINSSTRCSGKGHNPVKRAAANQFPAGDFFELHVCLSDSVHVVQRRRNASRLLKGNFELGFRGVCVCAGENDSTKKWQSVFPANRQALVAPPPSRCLAYIHTLTVPTKKFGEFRPPRNLPKHSQKTRCVFFLKSTAFNLIPTLLSVHGYKRSSDSACLEPPDQNSIKPTHAQPRSNYVRPALPSASRHHTPFILLSSNQSFICRTLLSLAQQRHEQDVNSLLEADQAGLRFVCHGNTHTHTHFSPPPGSYVSFSASLYVAHYSSNRCD